MAIPLIARGNLESIREEKPSLKERNILLFKASKTSVTIRHISDAADAVKNRDSAIGVAKSAIIKVRGRVTKSLKYAALLAFLNLVPILPASEADI